MIEMLHEGKEEGLIAVFSKYNRSLLYFVMQYVKREEVAEEIVSDVFIKVWKLREQFKTIDNLRAFLYISAKNASLNYLRTSYVKLEVIPIEECQELQFEEPDTLSKIIRTELMASIYADIEKLPDKQREVFLLTYIEDLDASEISERLGISVTAVYANRSRATATLRERFQLGSYLLFLWVLLSFCV